MKVADFTQADLYDALRRGELLVDFGPLVLRIQADDPRFATAFHLLYAEFLSPGINETVADITLQLRRSAPGTSIWLADGRPAGEAEPFIDDQFLPQFEWAVHFAIATALAPSIAFHAAVAADKSGRAVALVGASGSGKSTLVAGMVAAGWRLVADEFLIIEPSGRVAPLPGLITLKKESIDVVRQLNSKLVIGPATIHPNRGAIAHVTAPDVVRSDENVTVVAVVFPIFQEDTEMELTRFEEPSSYQYLTTQSHNLHVLGLKGFDQLVRLARLPSAELRFNSLDHGLAGVRQMLDQLG